MSDSEDDVRPGAPSPPSSPSPSPSRGNGASSSNAPLPKRERSEDDKPDLAFASEEELLLADAHAATRRDSEAKAQKTQHPEAVETTLSRDQGDGLDAYGNPTSGNGALPPSAVAAPRLGDAAYDQSMHNSSAVLKQQPASRIAYTAALLETRDAAVLLPQTRERLSVDAMAVAVDDLRKKLSKSPTIAARINPEQPKLEAATLQLKLVQDAHAACCTVTVLESEDQLRHLEKAERKELLDAAKSVPPPDDTLPARAVAVTILSNSGVGNRFSLRAWALLDAAAHLASALTSSDGAPAAKQTRVAFLYGSAARDYDRSHRDSSQRSRLGREDAVCASWCEADGTMRSLIQTIACRQTAAEYVLEIQKALASMAMTADSMLQGSRLLTSYANAGEPKGAYVFHTIAASHDFWSYLHLSLPPVLDEHATRNPQFEGALEFDGLFVKLVPKQPKWLEVDHPDVTHGLLVHQSGWSDEACGFVRTRKKEELEKQPEGARDPDRLLFGLRPPEDAREHELCPHILLMHADECSLGPEVTSYGLRGVPGGRFDLRRGSRLPRIVRRLMPLNAQFLDGYFALPCPQYACCPLDASTQLPLWKANEQTVQDYSYLFRNVKKGFRGTRTETQFLGKSEPDANGACHPRCEHAAPKDREPNAQEEVLRRVVGVPLLCSAFRVGDVLNAVADIAGPAAPETGASVLSNFLLAAVQTVGPDASIEEAFCLATQLLSEKQDRDSSDALQMRNEELSNNLSAAEMTICDLREKLQVARNKPLEAAPPPPTNGDAQASSSERLSDEACVARAKEALSRVPLPMGNRAVFAALRRDPAATLDGLVLKAPIKGASIKGILRLLAGAVGLDEDSQSTVYEWSKVEVCQSHYNDLLRLGRLLHRIVSSDARVLLLWNDKPDSMRIYEVKLGEEFVMGGPNATVKPVALNDALGVDPDTTLLLKWVVATRRLSLAECMLPIA